MRVLTLTMVKAKSKQSDLSKIIKFNAWGCELNDISIMSDIPNIEVASFSINFITSLAAFKTCTKLRELYLRHNCIEDIDELKHLSSCPLLEILSISENPFVYKCNDYRVKVVSILPNLKKLDNLDVTYEEKNKGRSGSQMIVTGEVSEEILQPATSNIEIKEITHAEPAISKVDINEITHGEPTSVTQLDEIPLLPKGLPSNENIFRATMCLVNELDRKHLQLLKIEVQNAIRERED